uniref:Large ribosomal subunit protein uL29c n=1 Tax=Wollemia nobilis TaxID=56998 RepID=A0A0C9RGT9_9CONI
MAAVFMGLPMPSSHAHARLTLSMSSGMGRLSTHFVSGRNPLRRIAVEKSGICSYKRPLMTMTVMMAKREQEVKEIREKSTEDINEEVIDLKGELQMLRFKKNTRQELKTSEFKRMRKRIARMLTVRRERELEQGIKRRQSRKIDRAWKRSIVVRPPPSLRKLQEEQAAKAEKKDS